MSAAPIVLLTDFGTTDWYVAEMKGALISAAPAARLVDFTHQVPPGDVNQAAFQLARGRGTFPAGTVFLVVVDPGVGTARLPIAVRAGGRFYVGPDNGVLEAALSETDAETRVIEDASLRERASTTFHGRDVFAPVAARLALGGDAAFRALGRILDRPQRPAPVASVCADEPGALVARVRHVDRFGNAITDLDDRTLERWLAGRDPAGAVFRAFGARETRATEVRGVSATYGNARAGEARLVALIGSAGLVELAAPGGHAALRLGLAPGDRIEVRYEEPPGY